MHRQDYFKAAKKQLEKNIFYHSLALEACMNELYDFLQNQGRLSPQEPSKEEWGLAGLIHDIDYSGEFKADHPNQTKAALALHNLDISDTVHNIVKAHAPALTNRQPQNSAEWAIYCADSLTGLITAVALVYPSRKLADVKLSSVIKRFVKEPKFAAGTRRTQVKECEIPAALNIPIEKFIEICLTAMKKIAQDIEL